MRTCTTVPRGPGARRAGRLGSASESGRRHGASRAERGRILENGVRVGKGISGRATDSLKRQIIYCAKLKRGLWRLVSGEGKSLSLLFSWFCDPQGRHRQRRGHPRGLPQVSMSFSSEHGPGARAVQGAGARRRRPGGPSVMQMDCLGTVLSEVESRPVCLECFLQPCRRPGRGGCLPTARFPRGQTHLCSSHIIIYCATRWRDKDKGDIGTVQRERGAGCKQSGQEAFGAVGCRGERRG